MTGQSIKVFNHHSTFVVLVSLLCEVIVNVFLLFFGCFDYYVVSPVSLLLPGEVMGDGSICHSAASHQRMDHNLI